MKTNSNGTKWETEYFHLVRGGKGFDRSLDASFKRPAINGVHCRFIGKQGGKAEGVNELLKEDFITKKYMLWSIINKNKEKGAFT